MRKKVFFFEKTTRFLRVRVGCVCGSGCVVVGVDVERVFVWVSVRFFFFLREPYYYYFFSFWF